MSFVLRKIKPSHTPFKRGEAFFVAGLLGCICAVGAEENESAYSSLPSLTHPSSVELDLLTPTIPKKDEYETTAEYEARLGRLRESPQNRLTVFLPLRHSYQADAERYEISSCIEQRVSGFSNRQEFSGENAMGAHWDWVEITGRTNVVKVENCETFYIPVSLEEARAIRDGVSAIGEVTLFEQEPYTSGNSFASPEFGKSLLDKRLTYTYRGMLEILYFGQADTGEVIHFFNFREDNKRERDRIEAARINESNWQKSEYRPIVKVTPIYPRRAQSRGITGVCEVTFTVTVQGGIRDPVAQCTPAGIFESASVKAARKLKYKPHTQDGRPVEVSGVSYKYYYEP